MSCHWFTHKSKLALLSFFLTLFLFSAMPSTTQCWNWSPAGKNDQLLSGAQFKTFTVSRYSLHLIHLYKVQNAGMQKCSTIEKRNKNNHLTVTYLKSPFWSFHWEIRRGLGLCRQRRRQRRGRAWRMPSCSPLRQTHPLSQLPSRTSCNGTSQVWSRKKYVHLQEWSSLAI